MYCIKCGKEIYDGSIYCNWCGKKQTPEQKRHIKRPNGAGTVYKLQGRRSRPWVAAKNKTIIGYYETKAAALDTLNRLTGKNITERYNMTFSDVYEAWKVEHYRDLTESGRASYDHAFTIFSSLHTQKFRNLKTADFQTVIDQHMNKANSTVAKYKQLITQMSRWAIREEIITTNLASFVKLPEDKKSEKEIFTDEDIQKLEINRSETARIILMLIYTGMRIGELFSLPLINYHERYVIGGEKSDAGRNRIIPIRPEGRKHFAYFAERATGDLLLSGYTRDKIASNFRKRNYYPLLDDLGISRKSPHATRHTFASWAVKKGIPPEVLQKILGHSKYSTTAEIYVHADVEQLICAVER